MVEVVPAERVDKYDILHAIALEGSRTAALDRLDRSQSTRVNRLIRDLNRENLVTYAENALIPSEKGVKKLLEKDYLDEDDLPDNFPR